MSLTLFVMGCGGGSDTTNPTTQQQDQVTQAVGTGGGMVVTPSGAAGVVIPAGTFGQQVMVTVTKIETPPTPGTGPLPTNLKQYGPYYDFTTSPQVAQFGDSARVGVCQVTDPSSSLYPPEPHDRLRLAHTVNGQLELLDRVDVSDFLRCSNVSASAPTKGLSRIVGNITRFFRPRLLYAAHGGLGGKVKSFSPFGAVQLATPLLRLTGVSAGTTSTCALGASFTPYCWGRNSSGQLGIGSIDNDVHSTPVAISSRDIFNTVIAGSAFACALTPSQTAFCWGRNDDGRVGNPNTTNIPAPTNIQFPIAVFANGLSGDHNCAVEGSQDHRAFCWGSNTFGQLGFGTTDSNPHTGPSGVMILPNTPIGWASLSVAANHTCGIGAQNAFCWGRNDDGRLGDGTTQLRSVPTLVQGGLQFVSVTAGTSHTCGLTATGAAYCWGQNLVGQLGNGAIEPNRTTPVAVAGGLTFASISAGGEGGDHTCGVTTVEIYCWGDNRFGQLGDGTTTDRSSPVLVSGGLGFESVSAGALHTCARTKQLGVVYCWGYNGDGQLGNGTTTNSSVPVRVFGQQF